ncbi:MAG: hypothetical protein KF802_16025 [Bdellovibrionaceae bacterium]|nr:hypothetical protein [Pseudobdellovibrionaceae bacterium]
MIAKTAIIHPNVRLGKNVVIEDYCIIGAALADGSHPETVIGDDARIRSHTVIYAGNKIGRGFQTGNKANIRENNRIGDRVSIGTLSIVEHHVTIEDGVRIHSAAFIPEHSVLKKNSWVGPHVVFTNAKVPLSPDAKNNLKGPTLEEGAIIGANSTLSPAVVIGAGTLVGSASNVTRDLPAGVVAYGHPARPAKERS